MVDGYGGGGSREEPPPDSSSEAGIEERMWQLDLASGSSKAYPSRPDEADCIYYLRTGYCGYGARCRFNHPPDRGAVPGAARFSGVEHPERAGQPVCQYFMRTGTCKFGASCKFHHPKQGISPTAPAPLNYHGFPLRPGAKECAYYMKTGQCKFGATCKFDHPEPAGVPVPMAPSQITPVPAPMVASAVYPPVQSQTIHPSQQYPVVVPRASLYHPSYGPVTYGPVMLPPGMVPYPGWSPYQAVVSPSGQPSSGSTSAYDPSQYPQSVSTITGPIQPLVSSGTSSGVKQEPLFPEKHGQPDCQHFLRTGYCKYGSSCRYHHPPDVVARETGVMLSPVGLPLRPDAPLCQHYAQHGICRYGQVCRFNHPMGTFSYSPSASSLTDMPVAPYPFSSLPGTLAPSSSSSELRLGSIRWRADPKSSQSGSSSAQAE